MTTQQAGRPLIARYIETIDYGEAWELQKEYVGDIDKGERAETLLLLQHPPTYTLGTDRHPEHLLLSPEELEKRGIAVFNIDRGGDITYHGPGQLVGYPLMYLDAGGLDLHGFLRRSGAGSHRLACRLWHPGRTQAGVHRRVGRR